MRSFQKQNHGHFLLYLIRQNFEGYRGEFGHDTLSTESLEIRLYSLHV